MLSSVRKAIKEELDILYKDIYSLKQGKILRSRVPQKPQSQKLLLRSIQASPGSPERQKNASTVLNSSLFVCFVFILGSGWALSRGRN
jgi:hypothetical protein